MKNRIDFINCPIDALTMKETVDMIEKSIDNNNQLHHVVVNAAKIVNMKNDIELRESVINSDIINADGQAVVWASRFLGSPLPERVAGIDLMENLVKLSHEKNYKIFFLGAESDVVKRVVDCYSDMYSTDIIGGYRDGYFTEDEEELIAKQIGQSNSQMLFVAITSPKKEIFLNKYKKIINIPFVMGVGGSFDVISGKVKRAPKWVQKSGLEWLYRLLQEPGRMWKRYLYTNSVFTFMIFNEKIKKIFRRV